MRVRRLLVSLIATAVAAPAAAVVATTAPAAAATETRIVAGSGTSWISPASSQSQPGAVVHGGGLSLSIEVHTADGQQVYDGTLSLVRQLAGQSTWTTVATFEDPYAYRYDFTKATASATYKVVYSGSGDFAPTEASKVVKVQRNLNAAGVDEPRRFGLKGKVAPTWAEKKVVVQKRSAGKWRTYRTGRTDARSRFFVPVAAPKRLGQKYSYRVVVAAGGGFVTSVSQTFVATRTS